ncbi:hypothetical protein JOQ06_004769, partial [Pogonophryne albipinna]
EGRGGGDKQAKEDGGQGTHAEEPDSRQETLESSHGYLHSSSMLSVSILDKTAGTMPWRHTPALTLAVSHGKNFPEFRSQAWRHKAKSREGEREGGGDVREEVGSTAPGLVGTEAANSLHPAQ